MSTQDPQSNASPSVAEPMPALSPETTGGQPGNSNLPSSNPSPASFFQVPPGFVLVPATERQAPAGGGAGRPKGSKDLVKRKSNRPGSHRAGDTAGRRAANRLKELAAKQSFDDAYRQAKRGVVTISHDLAEKIETVEGAFEEEQAFMLYAAFTGDLSRTAHALNLRETDVLRMADEGNWMERLKPLLNLTKSTRTGDVERAINRAMNFVMAHRYRMFLGNVLRQLYTLNEADLKACLMGVETSDNGTVLKQRITARAFADLATAMEKCHMMSYHALNDTVTDRKERREFDAPETAAQDVHAQIASAMKQVRADQSPRALLFREQVAQASAFAAAAEGVKVPAFQPPAQPDNP